jgi:glycosyltransferase involved in cell wall biosynthesis
MACDALLDGKDAQTTHVIELLRNLKRKNKVICFAPKPKNARYDFQEITYIPALNKPVFLSISCQLSLFFYLIYYCIKARPDAIYTRQSGVSFSPLIISKLFRIPYFVEVNGLIIEEMKIANTSKWKVDIAKLSEKLNYKHAKKIVAVTQALNIELKNIYNIPAEKIVVIENGANTDLFRPINKKDAKRDLDENYNYVGLSGSFAPWHGIEDLVRSAPLILKKVENTKFLLVGDGELKEQTIQMVNNLNLTGNFIFIDRVPYEEVPKYVNAFDVCIILKKKDIPGSPLKLWEYMACGKPVIATNMEDFRVLEEYNAGILVNPEKTEEVADAILTLLKNKELRDEMGKNGRKYVVENRSWERVAREVEKVMKKAASK